MGQCVKGVSVLYGETGAVKPTEQTDFDFEGLLDAVGHHGAG
jgi:hypothetical protein